MRLRDKLAFVTGAGSGIGRAGAIAMAGEGANLVVSDRDGAAAETTANAIVAAGGQATALALDMTDTNAIQSTLSDVVRRYGQLDILHSHAGIQVAGTLEQVSPEEMDASWVLNVRSHFVAARAVVGQMRAQGGGSIIITASNSGVQYDAGMIAYATTKHAAVAMARQMAKDYAPDNIRVNALCPGFVDTPFNAGFEHQMGGRDKLEEYVAGTIPMGRFASVEEIAKAIVYLASDESAFMTGAVFVVDGGECL
ncbi:MAG: SDR family oxidoreductase [Hyphomicrobiales bacterium]|nr:SDR family oxidoreductase [Hyphomicrobiales bacterium]